MSIASKIVLIVVLAVLPVIAVHTFLSLQREEALFLSDMKRDLPFVGARLREVAEVAWRRAGPEGVRNVIGAARGVGEHVALEYRTEPTGKRGFDQGAEEVVWVEPVTVDGTAVGEIVVRESLQPMRTYLRSTLTRVAVLTAVLIAAALAAARLLSHRLIGRRLDRLMEFAASTGAGNLGGQIEVGGNDEIASLAGSLGAMSRELAEAHAEAEQLNAERLGMLQHLRHSDRLATLGRLAASIAHEFGTPLNVVLGHANRIAEGAQTPLELKESATTIHRQVTRMETTIRDMLGFARQQPGEVKQVDLGAVADTVHALLQPVARRRGVQFELETALASAPVEGREIQLEQVLSSLVVNALDASPERGLVSLTLSREERTLEGKDEPRSVLVARVRDQGPGVPEEALPRLFEPFYTSKGAEGTGLGLWLADGIVRDHGGVLEVEPTGSEGGACFAMVLPESQRE
jgi:signal transduction histidine kinase